MPAADDRPLTVIASFRRTARLMVQELIARFEADGHTGLQAAHHALFENIDPQGTRLTELASRADMTHQSMSELVDNLEDRGWVERRPDPTDRRARLVCLTPEGRRLVRRGMEHIAAIEAKWQERWREAGQEGDVGRVLEHAVRQEERERASARAAA
jgi:DNA-binding MarR family transcriptional regulator